MRNRLGVIEMLDLSEIYKILSGVGPWGLILIVLVYILLKGQVVFRYPRPKRNSLSGSIGKG